MKHVAMFVTNPCTHDARVMKQAQSLVQNGHKVRIFALETQFKNTGLFTVDGYQIERVFAPGILWRATSWVKRFKDSNSAAINYKGDVQETNSDDKQYEAVNTSDNVINREITDENKPHFLTRLKSTSVGKHAFSFLSPARKLYIYYFFCKDTAKKALDWGADIAHCHDLSTMPAGKRLKLQNHSIKVVYDSHELWIHRNRVGRKAIIEQWLDTRAERSLIRCADRVITVCDSIGEWLSNRYPAAPKPIIIRNMPDAQFLPDSKEGTLKTRLNIDAQELLMLYVGKLTPGRGIEKGFAALEVNNALSFALLGYGDYEYVEYLKERVAKIGIESRVFFCNAVPHKQVSSYIKGADISLVYIEPVCLSYEYALPNKLFESIQAEVPILGIDLVEISRIVRQNDIGVTFANNDDMLDKLRNINSETIARWKERLKLIKAEFSWHSEKSHLIELYDEL